MFVMFGGGRGNTHKNKWNDGSLYRYSMFLNGYRVSTFYWECVIALRKSFITFVGVFFSSFGVNVQSYVGLIVIFSFLIAHVYIQPFANPALNTLETMALAVSFLTLYLGLIFYQGWLQTDGQKTILSMIIIFCNVTFIIVASKIMFGEFIKDRISRMKLNKLKKDLNNRTKIKPLLNAEINEETGSNKQRNRSASIDANIISNAEKAWSGYMLDGDENNGIGNKNQKKSNRNRSSSV